MAITLPSGAPNWLREVTKQIEAQFVERYPTIPVKLPAFQSTNLPDPAKYKAALIWVDDLNVPAVSTGSAWKEITLGSTL